MIGVPEQALGWERRRFIHGADQPLSFRENRQAESTRGEKKKYLSALAFRSKLELVIKKVILLYLIPLPLPHPQGFSKSKAG